MPSSVPVTAFVALLFYAAVAGGGVQSTVADSNRTVVNACVAQVGVTVSYDPAYTRLAYPMGDIDISRGVCTDVIIRGFRAAGIDLQRLIHEDMRDNFSRYPARWGLKKPDPNIDHRRVPNIAAYLKRKGKQIPVTQADTSYVPGDIVTWIIPGNLDHIGIVSDTRVDGTSRYAVVHNIGRGAQLEDVLFAYTITGHFRYFSSTP